MTRHGRGNSGDITTYHDLNIRQLRGYFTWRTHVRKGDFRPIATSLAYLYLYELLCGIGTDSTEDALSKMKAFEAGFLDSGIGDPGMRKNLRRWRFEYAVMHGLPAETVLEYADPSLLERDRALAVLKNPKQRTDEEIFSALCAFAGKKLRKSPVCADDESKGTHLFAEVWRRLWKSYQVDGKNIFSVCFGKRRPYKWYPLSNAVYWQAHTLQDTDYILNECRSYHLRGGEWQEKRYEPLHFNLDKLHAAIHEADRLFRKELKTGRYLRQKPEESWVTPYVEAVIAAERRAELEAARPNIVLDLAGLEKIRSDALVTRDSLLTEEETDAVDAPPVKQGEIPPEKDLPEENRADEDSPACGTFSGLDALHLKILMTLLWGQTVDELIKSNRLMPSLVADTINEALFDEIGDNVLECDGDRITAVEDYIGDVKELLGGNS